MATIPASENEFPELLFAEGAAPAAPATGIVKAYAKADGLLYWKDDAGVEYPVSQAADLAAHLADAADAHDASAISVLDTAAVFTATDVEAALKELYDGIAAGGISATIVDAKGDLIAATAADTVARLAVGSNGAQLTAASGESTGLKWSLPPGYEFDYAAFTSVVTPTATTEATANTVVTGNAVTYDGSTAVIIEFFAPECRPDNGAAGRQQSFWLYDGSSSIGQIGQQVTPATGSANVPLCMRARITPSAASHTYSIRASVSAGTGRIAAGAGGNGVLYPGFIRITKAN